MTEHNNEQKDNLNLYFKICLKLIDESLIKIILDSQQCLRKILELNI